MGRGNFFMHNRDETAFDADDKPIQRFVYVDQPDGTVDEMLEEWYDDLAKCVGATVNFIRTGKNTIPKDRRYTYGREAGLVVFDDGEIIACLHDNEGCECVTIGASAKSEENGDKLWALVEEVSAMVWSQLHHDSGYKLRTRTCAWTSKTFVPEVKPLPPRPTKEA